MHEKLMEDEMDDVGMKSFVVSALVSALVVAATKSFELLGPKAAERPCSTCYMVREKERFEMRIPPAPGPPGNPKEAKKEEPQDTSGDRYYLATSWAKDHERVKWLLASCMVDDVLTDNEFKDVEKVQAAEELKKRKREATDLLNSKDIDAKIHQTSAPKE